MDLRSHQQWLLILKQRYDAQSAAFRILGDLTGYRDNAGYKDKDTKILAAAMTAWVELCKTVEEPKR